MGSGHRIAADLHRAGNRTIIRDPGNAGTIRVRRSLGYCPLVSAGAETRTLGRPTEVGDLVTLYSKTIVGTITLTVTGGFNKDGDTTFSFTAADQYLHLIAVYDGTNFKWLELSNWSIANLTAAEAAFLDGITAGTAQLSKALVLNANLGISAFREEGRNLKNQPTPAALTTSATLTIANMLTGIVTGNQGAGAAATYTTDTGAAIETGLISAYPNLQNDDSFDFVLINISVVGAEDITIAAGASGVTLVGKMTVESDAAVTDDCRGVFRVRRTAQNVYTIYRIG